MSLWGCLCGMAAMCVSIGLKYTCAFCDCYLFFCMKSFIIACTRRIGFLVMLCICMTSCASFPMTCSRYCWLSSEPGMYLQDW